jgi:hypothetical protein
MINRVEELQRELDVLRKEVQFYRECFEMLQCLRETVEDVDQQLFLIYFFDETQSELSTSLSQIYNELHSGLNLSIKSQIKAEEDWVEFWGDTQ